MRFISKQFRRRCYKALAIAFALIAVLDVGLWIRGKFANDHLGYSSAQIIRSLNNLSNSVEYGDVRRVTEHSLPFVNPVFSIRQVLPNVKVASLEPSVWSE